MPAQITLVAYDPTWIDAFRVHAARIRDAIEAGYLRALTTVGYQLRIREPDWFEHRLLTDSARSVNLHIFSAGCPETTRMIRFRDRLRADAGERDLYQDTKLRLAERSWETVQQYADAKTDVVNAILTRDAG